MGSLKIAQLDLISDFFQERIVAEKAVGGSLVFVQRPKAKAEGAVQATADLPDDFTVASVSAVGTEIYRLSVGPLLVTVNYSPSDMSAELKVKLTLPIIGHVKIAHAEGNIKTGVRAFIGYKAIAHGEVGLRLDGNVVIAFWDVDAFSVKYKDEIKLLVL